ncbi:hypothetical protein B4071_2545 [Bacillus subtilis]|nr:hypothetical protein B4069_2555 [Bacillus subtilis]KIN39381.1 hypothetical protein B4070_2289 [Bacillus subtilis]KIN40524.1 hypothetical protein B4071_2545 [Bacillus subtilis]KIN47372.1 hypothetical protein B4072_2508 [Bacillus subtilis]
MAWGGAVRVVGNFSLAAAVKTYLYLLSALSAIRICMGCGICFT